MTYPEEKPSGQNLEPHKTYWDQQNRRQRDETLNEDYEMASMWAPDIEKRYGWQWVIGGPLSLFGGIFLFCWAVKDLKGPIPPVALRDLPYEEKYFARGKAPDSYKY